MKMTKFWQSLENLWSGIRHFTTLSEGGCIAAIIGICTALCAVMIAGIATCLQIVQIAFAWQYAFPGNTAELAADPL